MNGDRRSEQEDVDVESTKALIAAYYATLADLGASARSRAQQAFTITSALAGSVAVAALVGGDLNRLWLMRLASLVAFVLWAVAACLYVYAVASPVKPPQAESLLTWADWSDYVVSESKAERAAVDRRQRWANSVAVLAVVATTLMLVIALMWPAPSPPERSGEVLLSDRGLLAEYCLRRVSRIEGSIREFDNSDQFIVIEPDQSADCVDLGSATTLEIPLDEVDAVIWTE